MNPLTPLKTLLHKGLGVILPPICPMTGEIVDEAGMIHPDYWQCLSFLSPPFCAVCGLPHGHSPNDSETNHDDDQNIDMTSLCAHCINQPTFYDTHRAALAYDEASKPLILKFKHHDHHHLMRCFMPWLESVYQQSSWQSDLIIPVPLHYTRLIKRQYNQAALIAKALSKTLGIAWSAGTLNRIKATESQGHKSHKERQKNVKNAFAVKPSLAPQIQDKKILLVDDVYTTGATVNNCARILKQNGAQRVDVLTIARVLRD